MHHRAGRTVLLPEIIRTDTKQLAIITKKIYNKVGGDDMELDKIGYNHSHGTGFEMIVTKEDSWWLFLLIKTPAIFIIDGKEILTKPNSFILYTYGTPQHYHVINGIYTDDWFHLNMDHDDIEYLKSLDIPLNTVVELPDGNEISMLIRSMAYEFCSDNRYKNKICESYLNVLFLKLSRQLHSVESPSEPAYASKYDTLLITRNEIFSSPQKAWNIDEIARSLLISRSTLQHTYKKLFGTAISADIIASRMKRAKYYLTSTGMNIAEIAEQCGYNSDVFFMRQFKKYVGQSPTEYRNKI